MIVYGEALILAKLMVVALWLAYLTYVWITVLRVNRRAPAERRIRYTLGLFLIPLQDSALAAEYAREFPRGLALKIARVTLATLMCGLVIIVIADLVFQIIR